MLTKLTALFDGHLPHLIAFDLDGTLVDSVPDLAAAVDAMLNELQRPAAGEEAVRTWVGNGAAMLVKRALAGSDQAQQLDQITEPQLQHALEIFRRCYAQENGARTRLYGGVQPVLEALSALPVPLALITNKPIQFTGPLLQAMEIERYFQFTIGGECLPEKKPHPMQLEQAAGHFQVQPAHCLMVGDSKNDILAAKTAGWRSVALTYGYNHGEPVAQYEPDWVIDDFRELIL